jgi:tRNA (guanosine-2'-O-)-methyltransferase
MSQELYDLFCEALTPFKQQRFDEVVNLRTRYLTVVLEDLYQSHNTSAILRSMESFGIQDGYLIENTNPFQHLQRISKGAGKWLTLHRYNSTRSNTAECVRDLKNKGYRLAVTHLHGNSIPLSELDLSQKTALVMGTELSGASDYMVEQADVLVHIPMQGFTESLNVSAATSIALQHLTTNLRGSSLDWQLSEEEKLELKLEWARHSIHWWKHIEAEWHNKKHV